MPAHRSGGRKTWEEPCPEFTAEITGGKTTPSHPQITNSSWHQTASAPALPSSLTTAAQQKQAPSRRLHLTFEGCRGNHPVLPLSVAVPPLGWPRQKHFGSPFIPFLQPSAFSRAQHNAPRQDDLELNSGRWWKATTHTLLSPLPKEKTNKTPKQICPQDFLITVFQPQNKTKH